MNKNIKEVLIVSIIAFIVGTLGIVIYFLIGELIFILGAIYFLGIGLFCILMIPKIGRSDPPEMSLLEFLIVITCFSIFGLVILINDLFDSSFLGRLYLACGFWSFAIYNAYRAYKVHSRKQIK